MKLTDTTQYQQSDEYDEVLSKSDEQLEEEIQSMEDTLDIDQVDLYL